MERLLRTYFYWKNGLTDVSQSFKNTSTKAAANNAPGHGAPLATTPHRSGQPPNKRRRIRGGSSTAAVHAANRQRTLMGENKEIMGEGEMEEEAGDIVDLCVGRVNSRARSLTPIMRSLKASQTSEAGTPYDAQDTYLEVTESQTLLLPSEQETITDDFDPGAFNDYFGLIAPEETVVVRCYGGDDDEMVLQELRPRFVVMYDPEPAFVRRVEVSAMKVSTAASGTEPLC